MARHLNNLPRQSLQPRQVQCQKVASTTPAVHHAHEATSAAGTIAAGSPAVETETQVTTSKALPPGEVRHGTQIGSATTLSIPAQVCSWQ